MTKTTIDAKEVAKFSALADKWWDSDGPLKTLHDINPTRLAFINQYTKLANKHVLDVGCGGGILCEPMAALGAMVTGIDADNAAIISANAHNANRLNVHYVCSAIETFDSATFDVITCMELLEHVQAPEQVIYHCAQRLNVGGFLFLSTINRTLQAYLSAVIAAEYIMGLLPKQTHDYDKFIKPCELASMVRAMNLDVVGLQGIAYNPLSRNACLHDSVAVNYLMACVKR